MDGSRCNENQFRDILFGVRYVIYIRFLANRFIDLLNLLADQHAMEKINSSFFIDNV